MFVSCTASHMLVGKYCDGDKKVANPDKTIIILNSDKTFIVKSWSDLAGKFTSQGNWRNVNDTVFFYIKEKQIADTIIYQQNSNLGGKVRVKLIDASTKAFISGIKIIVNGNLYALERGFVDVDFRDSNQLFIDLLRTQAKVIIQENKNIEIDITLNFDNLKTIKLDSLYKLSGNKLRPLNGEGIIFNRCR